MSTCTFSPESLAAYDRSLPSHSSDRDKILAWIKASFYGMTSKELAGRMGKALHAVSGRISELRDMGLIKKCGRRDGCAIWISVEEPRLF